MIQCKKCDFLKNAPCEEHEEGFIRAMEESLKVAQTIRAAQLRVIEENLCVDCGCDLGPQDPMDHIFRCGECEANFQSFQKALDEERS